VTIAIRIEVLPARLGDCIIVECPREDGRTWRMLIDGGPPDIWPTLEARLRQIDPAEQILDVAVVSHIDSDHIGGMIPFLQTDLADKVGDYWFNGRMHLPDRPTRSVRQGESVVAALLGEQQGRQLPWNVAFGGGPIDTGEQAGFLEIPSEGGPHITVLSPTSKRLKALGRKWFDAIDEAKRGSGEEEQPDVILPLGDLVSIAADSTPKDGGVPNGSSIALLVEHRGASVVLGADAWGNVLGAGLAGVAAARGLEAIPVDAFKLPHHGSKRNVIEAMLKRAPAQHYVVSSNGDTFHHPDDAALARVVLGASRGATLWFNYLNARTERWADSTLCDQYSYATRYPESPATGVVLELEAKPR
jgi:beta-lactamase superfamily II metal-dependent hydrolase